jgi:hypothetical protein
MLNIIFTHRTIQHYYYENYEQSLIYVLLNLVMFPIALFIYKKERVVGSIKEGK